MFLRQCYFHSPQITNMDFLRWATLAFTLYLCWAHKELHWNMGRFLFSLSSSIALRYAIIVADIANISIQLCEFKVLCSHAFKQAALDGRKLSFPCKSLWAGVLLLHGPPCCCKILLFMLFFRMVASCER